MRFARRSIVAPLYTEKEEDHLKRLSNTQKYKNYWVKYKYF